MPAIGEKPARAISGAESLCARFRDVRDFSKLLTRDLEALKLRLAAMDSPAELPVDQAEAMRVEISAIRLHLKRLAFDRQAVADDLELRLGLRSPREHN